MKRIMTAIASLALLAGLASCQKEGTGKETAKQTEEVEITQVNLTASFLKTRVSYAETDANNLKPSWEEGDEIFCTADGGTFYKLTVDEVYPDGSASISGQGPGNGTVALLYKNGLDSAPSLPLEIDYDGQNGDEAMPNVLFASGTITDGTGNFEFTSAGSVVGVSYAKSLAGKTIKSVKIEGTNLSGAEVTYASNAFTLTATANESDAITTAVLSGITAGSDGVFNNPVFIAVPVGATISSVTVTPTEGDKYINNLSPSTAVGANQYFYVKAPDAPETPKDVFSVSATKKVRFSKGNLWADASGANVSNPVLHFEESQYAFIEINEDNHMSRFTWSDNVVSAVGNSSSGSNLFCDENHKVSVDGSEAIYYALSKDEWGYLLGMELSGGYYAPKTGHARAGMCGLATVNISVNISVNGLVLLPDSWELPSGCSFTATSLDAACKITDGKNFALNSYTTTEWSQMESAGAVFLPAAGLRLGDGAIDQGLKGYYWSSTALNEDHAYDLLFNSGYVFPDNDYYRYGGHSVRLVSDCNL